MQHTTTFRVSNNKFTAIFEQFSFRKGGQDHPTAPPPLPITPCPLVPPLHNVWCYNDSTITSCGAGALGYTAAFHARVRGSVPGLRGLKETKFFLPHPRVKVSIVGSLRDREVACSASDRQGPNFESCVWRTVSSHSSHHPQEVLLAQFSLYVHKGGLKPDSFHFLSSHVRHAALCVGPASVGQDANIVLVNQMNLCLNLILRPFKVRDTNRALSSCASYTDHAY